MYREKLTYQAFVLTLFALNDLHIIEESVVLLNQSVVFNFVEDVINDEKENVIRIQVILHSEDEEKQRQINDSQDCDV